MQIKSKFSQEIGISKINVPGTLAVNKFHNEISENCSMLVYISAHNIVKLALNKVLLLQLSLWNMCTNKCSKGVNKQIM